MKPVPSWRRAVGVERQFEMNVVEEIKADLSAVELIYEWFGDEGTPVHQMVAEARSERCVHGLDGKPCPMNQYPGWWEQNIKMPVARVIKGMLELKSNLKLEVPEDENLHMCRACRCCIRTKVWTPIKHIKEHTDKEALDKMPEFCWIKTEMKLLNPFH